MTECSKCGLCCDRILLGFDPQDRAAQRLAGPLEPWEKHQYEFLRDHWTVLSHDESCVVRCDRFDPATRECLAYDDRPDICSGYPWYGHDPLSRMNKDVRQVLPPQCSYTADVFPLLPLIVL